MPIKTKCPAFGKNFKKCGKSNHFAEKCKTGQFNQYTCKSGTKHKSKKRGKVNVVQSESSSESDDEGEECLWLTTVGLIDEVKCVNGNSIAQTTKKIFALMQIKGNKRATKCQVDSGATCNVIPEANIPLGTEVMASEQKLSLYNHKTMPVQGCCTDEKCKEQEEIYCTICYN